MRTPGTNRVKIKKFEAFKVFLIKYRGYEGIRTIIIIQPTCNFVIYR